MEVERGRAPAAATVVIVGATEVDCGGERRVLAEAVPHPGRGGKGGGGKFFNTFALTVSALMSLRRSAS